MGELPLLEILAVDDSATFRMILSRAVKGHAQSNLAGTAGDGAAALSFLRSHPEVNLILLDVSMPILDGLETLRRLRKEHPGVDAVMLSGVDKSQTSMTMQALSLGALDFVPKPQGENPAESFLQLQNALYPLFDMTRQRKLQKSPAVPRRILPAPTTVAMAKPSPIFPGQATSRPHVQDTPKVAAHPAIIAPARPRSIGGIDVIALGVSTGGPNALQAVIPHLPADLQVPIVAVQHMPPLFTASLAERLARDSKIKVIEAQEGMELQARTMYLAPGGVHMTLRKQDGKVKVHLTETAPVNSCRPSVDVLFQSVEEVYGARVLSVILTGMGSDGAISVASLRSKGAYSLIQDEATSVVWGMPGAVAAAGNADEIIALPAIAGRIAQIVLERSHRS
jgi:two-component system, chemotaxis family, protein-glutamate methylesterase/glutaminase